MQYSGGWSFTEAYNLPVGLRTWFDERLVKQIEKENEAMQGASQGAGQAQSLTAQNQPPQERYYSGKS